MVLRLGPDDDHWGLFQGTVVVQIELVIQRLALEVDLDPRKVVSHLRETASSARGCFRHSWLNFNVDE